MRRKGKIHPSPSSSSEISQNSSINNNKNAMAILKLLPVAILALVSVLSVEDSQVLAYMISRSIKATNPFVEEENNSKKNAKKLASSSSSSSSSHKIPKFDCECFDCYTSYWFRWDSSPNRELIHQAIEAYEEHLYNDEQLQLRKGKNKKKYKMGRRGIGKLVEIEGGNQLPELKNQLPELKDRSFYEQGSSEETEVTQFKSSSAELVSKSTEEVVGLSKAVALDKEVKPEKEKEVVVIHGSSSGGSSGGVISHKGLARKVLPDVLGLFNSRLWRLWSPNV